MSLDEAEEIVEEEKQMCKEETRRSVYRTSIAQQFRMCVKAWQGRLVHSQLTLLSSL